MTAALEVLNFLVLVWLLKYFFYRPVLAVIDARRAETAKVIADAGQVRREAEGMKSDYQARLAEIDKNRAAARAALDEEIAGERERRLVALEAKIREERERHESVAARQRGELEHAMERRALASAALFTTRLLDQLAGPELEAKLADLALSELADAAPDKLEALRTALQAPGVSIQVVSAYPLDETYRSAFTQSLGRLAGRALTPEFGEDAALKSGVSVMVGSWVLMANLRDELAFFAGTFEHGG